MTGVQTCALPICFPVTISCRGMICLPTKLKKSELEKPGGIRFYTPDLSRWQPKGNGISMTAAFEKGEPVEYKIDGNYIYKEIAVQPKRTKAAICRFCGCWKEHHLPQLNGHMVGYGMNKGGEKLTIKCCDHYEPLRVRVKSVMMEDEWMTQLDMDVENQIHPESKRFDEAREEFKGHLLTREAHREGMESWEKLQEALSMYPKGTKLARLELSR